MSWLDKMIGRVRDAKDEDEARRAVGDYIDPSTGERVVDPDDDNDTHIHLHLEKNGEAKDMPRARDDFADPNDPSGGDPDNPGDPQDIQAVVAALAQRVAALEDAVENGEGEMELQDPEDKTGDARRFTFRRGAKMKARDEESVEALPVRNLEIMGETDLPGIEDLDKRMLAEEGSRTVTLSVGDRRKARDKALRTMDSVDMEEGWRDMVALGEIIQPGVKVGTFDARLPALRTAERQCSFRRRVVDWALKDAAVGPEATALLGVRTVDGMKCDAVKMAFNSLGNVMRASNNAATVRTQAPPGRTADNRPPKLPTIAEMNKTAKEFWKQGAGNGAARR